VFVGFAATWTTLVPDLHDAFGRSIGTLGWISLVVVATMAAGRGPVAAATGFYVIDGHEPRPAGARVTSAENFARLGLPAELA
jgi:hypothetical protein